MNMSVQINVRVICPNGTSNQVLSTISLKTIRTHKKWQRGIDYQYSIMNESLGNAIKISKYSGRSFASVSWK